MEPPPEPEPEPKLPQQGADNRGQSHREFVASTLLQIADRLAAMEQRLTDIQRRLPRDTDRWTVVEDEPLAD